MLRYSKTDNCVVDLIFIPKHFFIPDIIEKRKPLSSTARRSGWVGANILIKKIPEQGRIPIILNGCIIDKKTVIKNVNLGNLLNVKDLYLQGWLSDVLNCINKIQNQNFSLQELYAFEDMLSNKHKENLNIKAKIRQQLQFLRDKGLILFLGNGQYKKVF